MVNDYYHSPVIAGLPFDNDIYVLDMHIFFWQKNTAHMHDMYSDVAHGVYWLLDGVPHAVVTKRALMNFIY
jgi:hypothetical protein